MCRPCLYKHGCDLCQNNVHLVAAPNSTVRLHTCRALERDCVRCLVVTSFTHHRHSIPSHCQEHIVWRLATPPGLANAVTRWAVLLYLSLSPGAFPPCLQTSRLRSLRFLSCSQSESVLHACDWKYCSEGHIRLILCLWRSHFHSCEFLRACQHVDIQHTAQSRPAPLMPSHFHHVALRDPEPFSQMQQQCRSCPSIWGVVVVLQSTQYAIIHKHEATYSTEHRYNVCVWLNLTQSAHTLAHLGSLRLSLVVVREEVERQ